MIYPYRTQKKGCEKIGGKKRSFHKKSAGKKRAGANSRAAKAGAPKKAAAKKQASQPVKRSLSAQTKAILLLAGAVLLLFLIFIPGENVWTFLHNVLLGLFGTLAIAWPLLLIYVAIITAMEKKVDAKMAGKLSLAIGVIVLPLPLFIYGIPIPLQAAISTSLAPFTLRAPVPQEPGF